ncbi:MAG: diaminopimelate epimerase [Methanobacteriaceae archaeon]|nr:diaminopimelate epimerase [Methanobacteriaceae archaeon]
MNEEIKFTKMHALGNDYIVINEFEKTIISEEDKNKFSDEKCTRGFSIGADGVIFVCKSNKADIRFRIFNSDGSEAEMCGNGIRCFTKYVYDNKILSDKVIHIETMEDIKKTVITTDEEDNIIHISVNMGKAFFKPSYIPVKAISSDDEFLEELVKVEDKEFIISAVSVGNPHAVIFTEDNLKNIDLNKYGSAIENHELFPEKTNVHFVNVISPNEIRMLTWERGAGFTYACGTGATSCAILGYKIGKLNEDVHVYLPGGELDISIKEDSDITAVMKGSAVTVYDGLLKI